MKRRRYPSDKRIRATVALARSLGLRVSAIEISLDGTIRTIDSEPPAPSAVERFFADLDGETGEREQ